jgi:DNA ligase 1
MLAATIKDETRIKFPCLVSPKLDGIRALVLNGKIVSRKLLPIRNLYVQKELQGLPDGLDGELMVSNTEFYGTESGIMTTQGEPDFFFNVFDNAFLNDKTFEERYEIRIEYA